MWSTSTPGMEDGQGCRVALSQADTDPDRRADLKLLGWIITGWLASQGKGK